MPRVPYRVSLLRPTDFPQNIHRALQAVLALPVPTYCHHGLLKDNEGKRLAKRDGARSLASLRAAGFSAQDVRDSLQRALLNGGIWQV